MSTGRTNGWRVDIKFIPHLVRHNVRPTIIMVTYTPDTSCTQLSGQSTIVTHLCSKILTHICYSDTYFFYLFHLHLNLSYLEELLHHFEQYQVGTSPSVVILLSCLRSSAWTVISHAQDFLTPRERDYGDL